MHLSESVKNRNLRLRKCTEKSWRAAQSIIIEDDKESDVIKIEESNNDDDTLRRSSRIKRPSLKVRESEENGCIQRESSTFQLKDRKKRRLLVEIDNNINKDAKNYKKKLDKLTRFVVCGICGTEDSCSKMLPIGKCMGAIKACDELSSAYVRKTSFNSQYSMDITQHFNEYGVLRIAEFKSMP